MSQQADSLKSIFFALGANAVIAAAKLFAAIHTGSNSMLAEAIHSFADCGNQGLLLLALIAVLLAIFTGDPVYDASGSIAIGILLVLVAFGIGVEIKGLLIGQSVEPEVQKAILAYLEARKEVARIFSVITLQLGDDVMVAVKAEMREVIAATDLVADINQCEAGLKAAFPKIKWVFFEPDVMD